MFVSNYDQRLTVLGGWQLQHLDGVECLKINLVSFDPGLRQIGLAEVTTS